MAVGGYNMRTKLLLCVCVIAVCVSLQCVCHCSVYIRFCSFSYTLYDVVYSDPTHFVMLTCADVIL